MKKVLIIGDSHVASIYRVYNKVEATVDIRFISATGSVYKYIEIIDGKLTLLPPKVIPVNPTLLEKEFQTRYGLLKSMFHQQLGASASVNLNEFDCCVLYGGNMLPVYYLNWWELTNQSTKFSIALLSDMLKEKINQNKKINQNGFRWMNALYSYASHGGNVYVLLNPYLNAKGLVNKHDSNQDLSTLKSVPIGAEINSLFAIYGKLFVNQMMKFISPPSDLYSGDSRAVSIKYKSLPSNDFAHLNAEGALLTLNKIVNDIGCEVTGIKS